MIQEEIKRRLNSNNACYHLLLKSLSSRLLPKHVKIRIYTIIILPMVLYWHKNLSLTIRKERRLRMFENRILINRIFVSKRGEVIGSCRKLHNGEIHNLWERLSRSLESNNTSVKCRRNVSLHWTRNRIFWKRHTLVPWLGLLPREEGSCLPGSRISPANATSGCASSAETSGRTVWRVPYILT